MTIQPINSAAPIPHSYTAEEYCDMVIKGDLSVLDMLSKRELFSIKIEASGLKIPLIGLLLKNKNPQFLEEAYSKFLDALSFDECMTPVFGEIPLFVFLETECLKRTWDKFRSYITPELLLRPLVVQSVQVNIAQCLFITPIALDVWNVVGDYICLDDIVEIFGKGKYSLLEELLYRSEPHYPFLDVIFTKFAEQFSGAFFCRESDQKTLGDRLIALSTGHPQYLFAVLEKIPLLAGFTNYGIKQLITASILHRPDLFPTLLERLCTEAPSHLAHVKCDDTTWQRFHATVENKPVVVALFMLVCGKFSEFEKCVMQSTLQLVFTDAQLGYIVRFPQYIVTKANNEFVVDLIECSKQTELSRFDVERLEKCAEKASALGCVNVWYLLGRLLERYPCFETDSLKVFSQVPEGSPYYYQYVLLRLQSGCFSRAFTGPEADKRLLLEKSLGFALKLPQNGQIATMTQAVQEIASYYVGIAKGAGSLERGVVPQHIIEKIGRTINPQTLFSLFDEIKAERALEAQKQLLLAENQKLSRQISLLEISLD
ncbi:MAG: hypothetical protein LLF94_05765 [Chlamydiales bacterium]|nr:hypothetical protein [Chlamydiales bacterium]